MNLQAVTPQMVKDLRDRTGVGMSKCKEALDEAQGDMEKAIDLLRKAGMTSSVKKEGRETKEGMIGVCEGSDAIAMIEVNTETDFVAQNEKFRKFVEIVACQAAKSKPKDLAALLQETYHGDHSLTVDQQRNLLIQSIGENIQVKRVLIIKKHANHSYGIYSHMKGKILTIVELDGSQGEELAKEIAMHVAAEDPSYLRPEEVPQEIKVREEEIAKAQIQGKPAQIVEKIVVGKMKAFYDQVCLLHQHFIKDNTMTVAQYVDSCGKKAGKSFSLRHFWRWQVGA